MLPPYWLAFLPPQPSRSTTLLKPKSSPGRPIQSLDRPNDVGRGLPPGAIPIESTRRVLPVKPFSTLLGPNAVPGQVIVKFKEEAEVRLRGKELAGQHRDMAAANHLLQMSKVNVARLMRASEAAVEASHAQAKGRGDAALADLNAFYLLRLPTDSRSDQTNLIDALNQLDVVELAYAPGRTELNWVTTPPAAPTAVSYEADQLYLNPPGWGVNARYAWNRGIKGAGVRVLDVEYGLNEQHEDIHFAGNYLKSGTNFASYASEHNIPAFNDYTQHGTAVAGVIIGQHNGYGISGLAPEVEFGLVSLFETATTGGATVVPAIGVNAAATDGISRYGDIVLIEVNSTLPEVDRTGCEKAFGPAEITLDGHSAVRAVSLTGRIVVEGAANDGQQLEACFPEADFQNRINRNAPGFLDSGAIMVGGGYYNPFNISEPIGIPYFMGFKYNYGNRLDVHGWGANVTTTGGYLFSLSEKTDIDPNQAYTKKFDGTSAASAVVAGATALVQGYYKTLTRPYNPFQGLNGFEMRQLLVNTGTPQQPATGPQNNQSMHIGPLPNVEAAMQPYFTDLIYPMIKANGLRNNVNDPNDPNCQPCIKIARGSTVNLDMSLWDGKFTGTPVDWWFSVNWNGASYYYTIDQGWITQQKPWFKNAYGLFGFWDWRWGSMRFDYPGVYTFFFGVDTIQNDTFMGNNNAISPSLYYDYVKIVVQ
ncbi:MAG: S8 family serine peptidase [Sulfuricellaceae bacterium]